MRELKEILKSLNINKNWTLFLDRDGVINKKIDGDYVRNWEQFEFLPNVIEALKILNEIFGRIIIVTNQRGKSSKSISVVIYSSSLLYLSSNLTISSSSTYSPTCTSIISKGIFPGLISLCFLAFGTKILSFS